MPTGYDLRNWLISEMHGLFLSVHQSEDEESRLRRSLNQWTGEYIDTPRDVIRVINAVKLYVTPQIGDIDLADAVFLQIIRVKKPELYAWVEEYVSALSAIGHGSNLVSGASTRMGTRLLGAIGRATDERKRLLFAFRDHLPGIDALMPDNCDEEYRVFSDISQDVMQYYAVGRRLASRHHYRRYFSYSMPQGTITDAELANFLQFCVEHPNHAVKHFRKLSHMNRPQGGKMGKVLLDRITEWKERISSLQVEHLFYVLGDSIDELARYPNRTQGYDSFLRGERHQVFGLVEGLEQDQRLNTLETLFREASALAWLSGIVRSSTIEQGYYGHTPEPTDRWLLTGEEFESIRVIYLERIRTADPMVLKTTPYFLFLMYAWYQGGDAQGARAWVEEQAEATTD